jgi:hypothetical protein
VYTQHYRGSAPSSHHITQYTENSLLHPNMQYNDGRYPRQGYYGQSPQRVTLNHPLIILRGPLPQVSMGHIRLSNPTPSMAYAHFKTILPANITHGLTSRRVMLHKPMPHLIIPQIFHTGTLHIRVTPLKILLQITELSMIRKRAMDNLPVPDVPKSALPASEGSAWDANHSRVPLANELGPGPE